MIHLILFGPPGSGKGTQAKKLAEAYNLLHVSTGDLFRSEIAAKTPLGIEAQSYMDRGELVPDEVTIGMLTKKIDEHPDCKGIIYDGFPRTVPQAEALDKMLDDRAMNVSRVVSLQVSENELVSRLLERGKDSGRADDRNQTVIQNRIKVYTEKTAPVAQYYAAQSKYVEVLGEGSIDEIFGVLCAEINKI